MFGKEKNDDQELPKVKKVNKAKPKKEARQVQVKEECYKKLKKAQIDVNKISGNTRTRLSAIISLAVDKLQQPDYEKLASSSKNLKDLEGDVLAQFKKKTGKSLKEEDIKKLMLKAFVKEHDIDVTYKGSGLNEDTLLS